MTPSRDDQATIQISLISNLFDDKIIKIKHLAEVTLRLRSRVGSNFKLLQEATYHLDRS
jgi:hypothetical protein